MEITALTHQDTDFQQIAIDLAQTFDSTKGIDIHVLNISEISSFADFFIIVSGTSHVHVHALADRARDMMARKNITIRHSEGRESNHWILLDYNSVIVHIFSQAAREYYSVEQLWGDAPRVGWSDTSDD